MIARPVRIGLLLAVFALLFAPGSHEVAGDPGPTHLAAAVLAPTGQPQDVAHAVLTTGQQGEILAGALAVLPAVAVALAASAPGWRVARLEPGAVALRVGSVSLRRRGPPPLFV